MLNNPVPLVTIRCVTYNHEPYIRQCLEGFVMQQTNFRFEAIVHDDASTDGTAAIIKEYAEKYPNIIKPIFETENQYSKRDGSLRRIMDSHMRGKYVAMCEGDDYWIDPLKLQKQVDFLENHPDYSMCFHTAILKWEKSEYPESIFYKVQEREYSGMEIFKHWVVATASVVFKSEVFHSEIYERRCQDRRFVYGDTPLFLANAKLGRIYGMKDVMSVYRKHDGGAIFFNETDYDIKRELKMNINDIAVYEIFGNEYKRISINRICKRNIYNYLMQNKEGRSQYGYLLLEAFKLNKLLSVFYYFYILIRYRKIIHDRRR